MWGQVSKAERDRTKLRIIPTRVGTSFVDVLTLIVQLDHPHACGDKTADVGGASITPGSSPRVWGQGTFTLAVKWANRIIPTRVGTSDELSEVLQADWDHPHACGDKVIPCSRSI